jgi:hypothetical protein
MGERTAARSRRGAAWFVAVAAVAALAGCTSPESDTAGSPPSGSRYFTLTDGTVAVSPVDRTIEVRWRDAGDDEWSEPVVAYSGRGRVIRTRTQVAGPTLAMQVIVSRHRAWTSVFVACADGSCDTTAGLEGALTDLPVLTPDGSTALLGVTEDEYVVWQAEAGLQQLEPTGIPPASSASLPLLASDGSLRVVAGAPTRDGCRFTLLTSAPGAADLEPATSYETPAAGPRCSTRLESFASDYVIVNRGRSEPAYLARRAGTWTRVDDDPSGRVRYPPRVRGELAGTVVRTRTPGGHEVLTATPDGRTLVVQLHAPGEPRWTAPREIAAAPPGVTCFRLAPTSTPTDDPFYVTLHCRARTSAHDVWTYTYVSGVTEDRETWTAMVGTDSPIRIGDDLLLRGQPAYRWSPEDGLRQVGLPVLDHQEVTLVEDGTQILTSVSASSEGCRLEVRVAEDGATEWSDPIPSDLPVLPENERCVPPQPQYDGDIALLYFDSLGFQYLPGQIRRRDGAWVVEAPRLAG